MSGLNHSALTPNDLFIKLANIPALSTDDFPDSVIKKFFLKVIKIEMPEGKPVDVSEVF